MFEHVHVCLCASGKPLVFDAQVHSLCFCSPHLPLFFACACVHVCQCSCTPRAPLRLVRTQLCACVCALAPLTRALLAIPNLHSPVLLTHTQTQTARAPRDDPRARAGEGGAAESRAGAGRRLRGVDPAGPHARRTRPESPGGRAGGGGQGGARADAQLARGDARLAARARTFGAGPAHHRARAQALGGGALRRAQQAGAASKP